MDVDEEELLHARLRNKAKPQPYLIRPDVLELKPRIGRQGKCVGASREVLEAMQAIMDVRETSAKQKEYNHISDDIWFHLANYIPPEHVKRYALICSQSANSIKSRGFWLQLYRKYCQQSGNNKSWNLELPARLQIDQLSDCDVRTLRQRVIQALFYCHKPFTRYLADNYKLERLEGTTYVSCWHLQVQCVWIMCYKFCLNFPLNNSSQQCTSYEQDADTKVANDWESLADDCNNNNKYHRTNKNSVLGKQLMQDYDGVSLLIICCNRYIPFPSDFIYTHTTSSIRLAATRELLSTDMRSINLEMDLISSVGGKGVTWKYNQIQKYKVLPWWHPDFGKFNKCE